MQNPRVSFLVLDYEKPEESRKCLQSIKTNAKFPHYTIFLSNGTKNYEYCFDFYREGLIDKLILRKDNTGCGNGTVELSESCETEYFIYVQNDQFLIQEINEFYIKVILDKMELEGFNYIDLSGAQAGYGNFTERAGIFKTEFYKKIPKGEKNKYGGPGPFNNVRYVESYVQQFFKENKIKVEHLYVFQDNGKWSIREIGDGIYKHRCDSKNLFVIKKPSYRTDVYPPLNDKEWDIMLKGEWIDGTIPEEWAPHSFKCFID